MLEKLLAVKSDERYKGGKINVCVNLVFESNVNCWPERTPVSIPGVPGIDDLNKEVIGQA